jgi:hypothetical protein
MSPPQDTQDIYTYAILFVYSTKIFTILKPSPEPLTPYSSVLNTVIMWIFVTCGQKGLHIYIDSGVDRRFEAHQHTSFEILFILASCTVEFMVELISYMAIMLVTVLGNYWQLDLDDNFVFIQCP